MAGNTGEVIAVGGFELKEGFVRSRKSFQSALESRNHHVHNAHVHAVTFFRG